MIKFNDRIPITVSQNKRIIKKAIARLGILNPFSKPFTRIEFATTNVCNRACFYCPNAKYERNRVSDANNYMPESIFDKLIKNLKEIGYKGIVAPHFYGEPLLDSRLTDWIVRIRAALPKCTIRLVTNGDLLDRKRYDELIAAGVDYFEVSKHDAVLGEKVNTLLESLSLQERKHRIKVLDFYSDYRNQQVFLTNRGGDIALKKKGKQPICCISVTYPVINIHGEVILCCNDYHSKYVSGNITKHHLTDIWNSPENINLRKRIFKGYFDLAICQNCYI